MVTFKILKEFFVGLEPKTQLETYTENKVRKMNNEFRQAKDYLLTR